MISIHELLELNGRKPVLNRYLKFFSGNGKRYAYMNRLPFRISFMEVGSGLQQILEQCDGTRTINDIIISNSLDSSVFEVFKTFYRNSVLRNERHSAKVQDTVILTVSIYPTNNCNLRCVYCYASAGEGPALNISMETAEAWIDYLFRNKPASVKKIKLLFHGGGEPTTAFILMKKIWEIIKSRCEKENLEAQLDSISNGNFSEEILNWFIREKAFIYFSIDGIKEFHDRLRPRADGRGSFETAFRNIRKIKEAGLTTGIRCTVASTNKTELKKMVDLVKENNLDFLHFGQFSAYGRSKNPGELEISNDEYREVFVDTWKYAFEKGVRMTGYPVISILPGGEVFCSAYAKSGFAVTPEGYLSPCPEISLSTDPLADIFLVGKVKEDRNIVLYEDRIEKLRSRNTENIPECRDCYLEFKCAGGCFVKNYRKYNDMLKVDNEECEMIRRISIDLLKTILYEHEKIPEKQKKDYLKYTDKDNNKLFLEYISFDPF